MKRPRHIYPMHCKDPASQKINFRGWLMSLSVSAVLWLGIGLILRWTL